MPLFRKKLCSIWLSNKFMNYHPVVEKIKNILIESQIWFETFEHEPVTTSEDASKVRIEYALSQGVKALIVRAKTAELGKHFIMVCVPGDKRFNAEKLKENFGITDTRFASEEEVSEITGGVQRGGVPPFGNLFNLAIYADSSIFANERIIFNAGDRSFSIGMLSADYLKLINPKVADIIE